MRNTLLITASVAALMAGIGLASAQGMNERREAPAAAAPEQKAPDGQSDRQKAAPPQKSDPAKPAPTAQAPEGTKPGPTAQAPERQKPGSTARHPRRQPAPVPRPWDSRRAHVLLRMRPRRRGRSPARPRRRRANSMQKFGTRCGERRSSASTTCSSRSRSAKLFRGAFTSTGCLPGSCETSRNIAAMTTSWSATIFSFWIPVPTESSR